MLSASASLLASVLSLPAGSAAEPIVVRGSWTVREALVERAQSRFPELDWRADGCAGGFADLLAGEADVAVTLRSARPHELALASWLGVNLRERVAGFDALAVVVHPDNRVDDLSLEQLAALYSGEVARWMGVGGSNESTRILAPSRASGARDAFIDRVLGERGLAPDAQSVDTPADMLRRVSADRGAVGLISMKADRSSVKTLTLAGVAPTAAAVVEGAYPLWYPILVHTIGEPSDRAHAFLAWLLLQEGQGELSAAGFLPAPGAVPLLRVPLGSARLASRTLVRVRFAAGTAQLGRDARDQVDSLAERAVASAARILLIGHAAEGERLALAEERVRAVSELVSGRGLSAERLDFGSAGADLPASLDPAMNRRVDVWVLPPP